MKAWQRLANLKRRMDHRSRWMVSVLLRPLRFIPLEPLHWLWRLRA